jgi:hypothetical protein
MFAVEIYAAGRRFVFVEGKSGRETARDFGLSRDTISRCAGIRRGLQDRVDDRNERPELRPLRSLGSHITRRARWSV